MALTRKQKEVLLQDYAQKLSRSQVLIWSSYQGMTVAQISDLRRQLRATGAEALVVKDTIMRLALKQAGMPVDAAMTAGPRVVIFVHEDLVGTINAVTAFARANEAVFKVAGGLVGGKLATVEDLRTLTTLPSREVLLARVVGGIQAPISSFVGTLAAVMRGLVNVLDARAKQLEGAAS